MHTHSHAPDSHRECVNVFIKLIQQTNGLDDHVVRTVDIKLYFGTGVRVSQTQLGLGCSQRWEALH